MKSSVERHVSSLFPAMLALAFASSGCRVVGGIFKAGIWVGIVAVLFVVALGFGLMRVFRRAT